MKGNLILIIVTMFHYVITQQNPARVPCKGNHDCTMLFNTIKNTFCKDGFCMCGIGTELRNCSTAEIAHPNNRSMGPTYRTCKLDQDCQFTGGTCNTTISRCECQKEYVFSANRQQCLRKAEAINFPCSEDKQCSSVYANATCHDGECVCIPGYHFAQNNCHKTVELGSTCKNNQECSHVDGAVCNEKNVCGCPAETIINGNKGKCLKVAREILEKCDEDVQCNTTFLDSLCINKTCQCQYEYHFESEMSRCFNNKAFDENCGNSYECYQVDNKNDNVTKKALKCVSNKCVCAENFYREDNTCVSAAAPLVGSALLLLVISVFTHGVFLRI